MTAQDLTTGPHFDTVLERLTYATTKAGSVGLGEYTRVHKKDLAILIEAFKGKIVSLKMDDVPVTRELTERLDRVRYFLTPESATKAQLQEAVDLAVYVLATGKARGVEPQL